MRNKITRLLVVLLTLSVSIGLPLPEASAQSASNRRDAHTAKVNAAHMELRQNNVVVCKVYYTNRNSPPTATGCPTSGTARELLWNTSSDGSWYQVSKRTVTLGAGTRSAVRTGVSTAVGGTTPAVRTGVSTAVSSITSAVQTGAATASGNGGRYTAKLNAAHMELRQNNVVVCKVYYTNRNSPPTATGCPTSGTFRELLWNTNSDGSWYQVSKRTVTIP